MICNEKIGQAEELLCHVKENHRGKVIFTASQVAASPFEKHEQVQESLKEVIDITLDDSDNDVCQIQKEVNIMEESNENMESFSLDMSEQSYGIELEKLNQPVKDQLYKDQATEQEESFAKVQVIKKEPENILHQSLTVSDALDEESSMDAKQPVQNIAQNMTDKYDNKENFQSTDISHSNENKEHFQCTFCEYKTDDQADLDYHRSFTHIKLSNGKTCVKCDKTFAKTCYLKIHIMAVHDKIKPFKCMLCNFKTVVKAELNRHVAAVHHKVKEFACHLCDKQFARKCKLTNYVKAIHTGIREFKCTICD